MRAVHPRERSIVEGLDAKRYAIHASSAPGADRLTSAIVRVGLDRNFGACRRLESLRDDIDQTRDTIGAESGRGPPAEVQGVYPGAECREVADVELAVDPADEVARRHLATNCDGEVAVGASARTERHV